MEEESLKCSIETYKTQLGQVDQAIQAAGETDDLVTLRRDLRELIQLSEESLLSLKKSQLLQQLDDNDDESKQGGSGSTPAVRQGADIDDEYAAFQAMLADDVSSEPAPVLQENDKSIPAASDTTDTPPPPDLTQFSDTYKEIIGTKCRAPFVQDWGARMYGNAMIAAVEVESHDEMPKVRVMFCNPTHASMLPCQYFLEGNCKFTQENCRYSHGYQVALEDLQEYTEPDYRIVADTLLYGALKANRVGPDKTAPTGAVLSGSTMLANTSNHVTMSCVKLESQCLARYEDDIWYRATVVDLHDDNMLSVTFDSYDNEVVKLPLEDIWPLDDEEVSNICYKKEEEDRPSGSRSRESPDNEMEDEDEELPVFLWKPPSHGLGDLGQWEAHTRGIGSRLMSKMGYELGKGLGRDGAGRVEPVPIQLLPQGKTLDAIMELREKAGGRSMFDVVKKLENRKKQLDNKLTHDYKKAEQPNVFDFINKKLGGKKGKLSELVHKHEGQGQGHLEKKQGQGHGKTSRTISEHELAKKSDRNINIQLLKTGEEIKTVQKELLRLKQALARNENKIVADTLICGTPLANRVDPDETAPTGAVSSGSTLFANISNHVTLRDRAMCAQIKQKIASQESYLAKLRSSESTINSHQKKRSDHRKLTVF